MWPFRKKKADKIRNLVLTAATAGGAGFETDAGRGWKLGRYQKNGAIDYEAYRIAQNVGNAAKLNKIFADPALIGCIAGDAAERLGEVRSVLCHGSRNGAEIKWFGESFPGAKLLGTDIADSATQFPNTIQWDFHDMREDWRGAWDVIYSNSWDHALEPLRAFGSWADSLRPGGVLYLEHSPEHEISDPLDLFAASEDCLIDFVSRGSSGRLIHIDTIGRGISGERIVVTFANQGRP